MKVSELKEKLENVPGNYDIVVSVDYADKNLCKRGGVDSVEVAPNCNMLYINGDEDYEDL